MGLETDQIHNVESAQPAQTTTSNNLPLTVPSESFVEIEEKVEVVIDEVFVNEQLVKEAVFEKFEVSVEGIKHLWHKSTITTVEIARLGGWSHTEGVLCIDKDNNERTMRHDEEVCIEVGIAFAKKVRFKRG